MGGLIYLLDTNILSEPAKAKPNTDVMERLERYEGCYCTAATVWHELRFGCEKLPSPTRLFRPPEFAVYRLPAISSATLRMRRAMSAKAAS
jgi:predicted nucleic acid-binding protein